MSRRKVRILLIRPWLILTGGLRTVSEAPQTLDLYEAADYLKMHWQTLRAKAKRGEVPGAKLGKRWVFLADDLASHLRAHYSASRPRSQVQLGDSLCCTSEPTRRSGGVVSRHLMDVEYKRLLRQ
ncbi:MAG: helix-turn-helix domain-containing protein [Gammaproteobacteria bacterium]